MPKQKGAQKLVGTFDDITYYKSKNGGWLARKKTSLNKKRVRTDPAFEGSRGASSEFGRASSAGALLRGAFAEAIEHVKEHTTHHRLNKRFRAVIESDKIHDT